RRGQALDDSAESQALVGNPVPVCANVPAASGVADGSAPFRHELLDVGRLWWIAVTEVPVFLSPDKAATGRAIRVASSLVAGTFWPSSVRASRSIRPRPRSARCVNWTSSLPGARVPWCSAY